LNANDEATIPTVDLSAFLTGTDQERRQIANRVDDICRSIGFLIIENHGISGDINDAAWSAARRFFDLSIERKNASQSRESGCPRGYFPLEQETLAKTRGIDTPPDLKECFSSGPLSPPAGHLATGDFEFFYGKNLWPAEPAEFRRAWTDYYVAMDQLGSQLMQMLALALQLESDYFVEFHTHHLGALRALNYPPIGNNSLPGQLRAGAHSDYGSVTILKPDPTVGGLEVQHSSGNWISAPAIADAYIVNIGDLLARWTNDRWVSTMHRVVDPIDDKTAPRRQSIAYFMNPNYDAEIDVITTCVDKNATPKYPAVLAGRYLVEKFRSGESS
jgi:isopenicillin N synthase-like dioxygenase